MESVTVKNHELIEDALEKVFSLKDRLKRLELGSFPRANQKRAVDALHYILSKLKEGLELALSTSEKDANNEDRKLTEPLWNIHETIGSIYDFIEKLELSSTSHTPLGAIYLVEHLAEKVKAKIAPIICFHGKTFSHLTLNHILKLEGDIRKRLDHIVMFTIPATLRDDVLSYCLVTRELTLHVILTEENIDAPLLSTAADVLSSLMLGPAYLYALEKFLQTRRTPPSEVTPRLSIIAKTLKDEGYPEHLLTRLGSNSQAQNEGDEALQALKQRFKKTRAYYPPEQFNLEVPQLTSRILALTPPNEIVIPSKKETLPAQVPSIINAGWLVRKNHMNKIYEAFNAKKPEEKYQVKRRFNALIEKAIELSIIHKTLMEGPT